MKRIFTITLIVFLVVQFGISGVFAAEIDMDLQFDEGVADPSGNALWSGGSMAWNEGLVRLFNTSSGSVSQSVLNVSSLNRTTPFVVEMRVKTPSTLSHKISLKMNGGDKAVDISSHRSEISTADTIWTDEFNSSAVIGRFRTDISPVNPDFTTGFNTFYFCVDPILGTYSIYMDSLQNSSSGTFAAGTQLANITFEVSKLNAVASVSELYLDYIKVYGDESKNIPVKEPARQRKISSGFDGLNIGDNLRKGLFTSMDSSANLTALVANDPITVGNKCVEIKNTDAATRYAYIVFPCEDLALSFRVYIPQTPVRNEVQFRNEPLGAVVTNTFTEPDGLCSINGSASTPIPFVKGAWNEVKWVVKGSEGRGYCYVNGATEPMMSATGTWASLQNVRIGVYAGRSLFLDDINLYELDGTPIVTANKESGTVEYGEKIKLNSDITGSEIYYTTDGSEPSKTGVRYTDEGIAITEHGGMIRAACVSPVSGWTYDFGPYYFNTDEGMVFAKAAFKKNNISLTGAEIAPIENDSIEAELTVINTEADGRTVLLIVGLFDGETLLWATRESITIAGHEEVVSPVGFTVPGGRITADWNLKAFVLDSAETGRTLGFRKTLK